MGQSLEVYGPAIRDRHSTLTSPRCHPQCQTYGTTPHPAPHITHWQKTQAILTSPNPGLSIAAASAPPEASTATNLADRLFNILLRVGAGSVSARRHVFGTFRMHRGTYWSRGRRALGPPTATPATDQAAGCLRSSKRLRRKGFDQHLLSIGMTISCMGRAGGPLPPAALEA